MRQLVARLDREYSHAPASAGPAEGETELRKCCLVAQMAKSWPACRYWLGVCFLAELAGLLEQGGAADMGRPPAAHVLLPPPPPPQEGKKLGLG